MPFINFSNPLAVLLAVILFLLVLFLGRNTKKAWILGIMLFVFLGLLVGHTVEFVAIEQESEEVYREILNSAIVDLVFVFLSFISYLWVDDMETKAGKKKSIDNSLDWFWNKV